MTKKMVSKKFTSRDPSQMISQSCVQESTHKPKAVYKVQISGCKDKIVESTKTFAYYLCGFADGEACFSVSYRRLSRLKVGIESRPSFSIAQKQNPENYRLLARIRDFLGGGAIRKDAKGCYKYETRSLEFICHKIIPFFERYKLLSRKQKDFIIFSTICSRMGRKEHLSFEGLLSILELSRSLNPSGTRVNPLDSLIHSVVKKKNADKIIC